MGIHTLWQPDLTAFIEVDHEVVRKLQYGAPEIGWRGDPNMEIAYNKQTKKLELWRNGEDAKWHLLMESKPGARINYDFLLYVRDHDPQRGYDAWSEIDKHNNALRALEEQKLNEAIHESADRIAYELRKRM